MGSLGDGVKKVLLAGIGTVAVTAEKSKEVLDKMAERSCRTGKSSESGTSPQYQEDCKRKCQCFC